MHLGERALRLAVASPFLLMIAGACGSKADDGADAQAPGLQCCIVQKICDNCVCDESVSSIGESSNEAACESFLDDADNYGCDSATTTAMPYREAQAIADCS